MSTPTTANPTVPPRYNPQHYPHYQHHSGPYPPASTAYRQPPASTALSSSTRLPPPYAAAPSAPAGYSAPSGGLTGATPCSSVPRSDATYHSTMPTASASFGSPAVAAQSDSLNSRKRRRDPNGPDWNEFYKNGLPSEIIVIDDTPEPDNGPATPYTTTTTTTTITATAVVNGTSVDPSQPLPKRRKRDDAAVPATAHHESIYQTRQLLSQASTPKHHSPTTSASSSGRTTSAAHTTAATSIGSASSNSQYDYEAVPGQKRKRTARQQVNDNKRLQAELAQDPLRYRTPPQPIKKSAEIKVPVIPDKPYRRNDLKYDDDDGHYIVVPEADLTEDYQMLQLLGQGTFGKVVKARDKRRNKLVAIKIIRSVQKYRDASKIELRVLATLKANDPDNRNRCIHFRNYFDFRNHICIVTDLLDVSVFDFLKSNNYVPFPNSQIQHFARQLFTSVAFLHDLNLIHTDLKPENILLCNSAYQTFTYNRKIPSSSTAVVRQANQRKVLLDTEIRLIDFGSATFQDEYHSQVVSTRHYRAPEIMLGLGWSFECDIWSIGCILVEFFTGDALFQTHDNLEHLAMMEAVVGSRIDTALITQVNRGTRGSSNPASQYFKRHKLDYPKPETTRASKRYVKGMKQLRSIIPSTNTFLRHFLDLLEKIFVYDPKKRIKAKEALKHPWFQEAAYPDDGTEAAKIRRERMSQDIPGSRAAPLHV